MEKNNPLSEMMQESMAKVREMADTNTIVGQPIQTPDGVTLIPISRVSFGFGGGGAAFGAFSGGEVVGFAALAGERLGSRGQYADLALFYVSEPHRGRGVGGALFRLACAAAREAGAEKLYISAHSAAEVVAAYRALGCVEAEESDAHHAAAEPWDVQMELRL